MDKNIHVLIIDDDLTDIMLAKRVLSKCAQGMNFTVESAQTLDEGIAVLHRNNDIRIILLDLGLPDSSGIETVRIIKQHTSLPVVVLTGLDDDTFGLEAIQNGATDYLIKGSSLEKMLVRSILYAIEREKIRRELQLAEEKYRTVFENSAVAITLVDENERIISWNKFTETMLQMQHKDLYHKPVKSFYPEDQWGKIRSFRVREKGMEHHLETKMLRKDGSVIDVDVSISVLKDTDNRVTGSIGIITDITERKQAEKKMHDAMEIKSQFISTVSHELRTPLTIIKEDIAIILDGSAGRIKKKQREILGIAKRNVDRLARLINDVLDFQKLEAGRIQFDLKENNINDIVKDVHRTMQPMTQSKQIDFILNLDTNIPRIKCDNDKIVQVLTNLVSNAAKFAEQGKIMVSTTRGENTVLTSVSDTGKGIKPEDLPKLFNRFQQLENRDERKTGGTGLGLAISKQIVHLHGGKIWAESQYGEGTTFHFLLPILERRTHPRQEEQKQPQTTNQQDPTAEQQPVQS